MRRPKLYVIAGPNGAGKTTFARRFLPESVKCMEFVNSGEVPKVVAFEEFGKLEIIDPQAFSFILRQGRRNEKK